VFKLPEVMSNDAIQLLLQKRAERRAEYQNQLRVFRPNYEPMQQLSADIAELDSQVNAAANNIRDTLRTQYEVSRRQEQALASDVGELKAETLDEQRRSIRYNILKREAETNRVLYDALLQRYKEVSLAGGLAVSNVTVIDQARSARKPVQPRPLLNMAAGGLLGLILALALVVARSRFDDTVRSPADLEGKLGLPLLGITPAMTKGREPLEVLAEARSDLSEAFASVRAALDLASARGAPKPLLVTSTRESEGKSTSAAALAVSFARIGRDVLLIDADLRRPSLHTMFGLPRTKGLSTLLASHDGLADAVQPTTWPNLSVVAAGPPPPSPSGLLAEPRLRGILQEAAAKYDVVIVDAPPVMGLADVPLLAAAAAGVVYVVEAARTHRGQLRVALARIRAVDGTVVGALLTKFDPKEAAVYGGDYASAYRYGYGEAA
jgi:capsular exopolysaccharide synthesis family protein